MRSNLPSAPSIFASTKWLGIFALFLLLPGTYWIQRLTTNGMTAIYIAVGTLGCGWLIRRSVPTLFNQRASERLAYLILLLLIVGFWVVYPRVNCQTVGCGSDRDDALNLASEAVLAGQYPYYPKTYHNNPITPLPGAIVLAAPFYLLFGNAAYQTFFWLAAFFLVARSILKQSSRALFVCGFILLSPAVLHELLSGGDLFTNSVYVLVLGTLTARIAIDDTASPIANGVLAILFGLSLASRPNFMLFGPLVIAYIAQHAPWPAAIRTALISGGIAIGINIPFYLFDPANFTPLTRTSELSGLDTVVPSLGSVVVPLAMLLLTGWLCQPRYLQSAGAMLLNMGTVQLLPIMLGTIVLSFSSGSLDLQLMSFGPIFIAFGALGAFQRLTDETSATD